MRELYEAEVDIMVFPEMIVTGYTLGDLRYHAGLAVQWKEALEEITVATEGMKSLVAIGVVLKGNHGVIEGTALLHDGEVLSIVPKRRNRLSPWAEEGIEDYPQGFISGEVPEGILYDESVTVLDLKGYSIGVFAGDPEEQPETIQTLAANCDVILHQGARPRIIGSQKRLSETVKALSGLYHCAWIYAGVGNGESSTDFYYDAAQFIMADGEILAEQDMLREGEVLTGFINLQLLRPSKSRKHGNGFFPERIPLTLRETECGGYRLPENPFMPMNRSPKDVTHEALDIQIRALAQRMDAIGVKRLVLGVSGGLDSTLALIVSTGALEYLGFPRENLIAVTMPCFGTSGRTFRNSIRLLKAFRLEERVIEISEPVRLHLEQIGHDGKTPDAAFENAQARERTQVLLDLANMHGALVVGTGDLSEIALGFATFNGDHISNYSVNASVPKTLMRMMIGIVADESEEDMAAVLLDILETPVSPELIPGENKEIVQQTETVVGPYELQDFFIYYHIRYGLAAEDLVFLAGRAFGDKYSEETIRHWLSGMYRRFLMNQFKRSCSVDGPMVTEISLSPRGGWRMASDVDPSAWVEV